MIVILAEKPSVARGIAAVVGANEKQDGCLKNDKYIVTWALGHLIQLAMPEEYGAVGFKKEHLPIIPDDFILTPRKIRAEKGYQDDTGALKQLKILKKVFDECEKIIVATDAGREGELIFRYIYNYLKCDKPFERLWISSLTEKAIREGLQKLQPGENYDTLYYAAQMRSEADWMVGINASQALSIIAGSGVFSLGRVQTPTLSMICKRYLENKNFTPIPYWQVKVQLEKNSSSFNILSADFEDKQQAEKVLSAVQSVKELQVVSVEGKEVKQEPPLLYDLTTLQKEANTKFSFSADKTLSTAQKLYEAQLITYPRTGSRYLSQDVFEMIPELVSCLYGHETFCEYAKLLPLNDLNNKSVDDKKVTDHHAIIITEKAVKGLTSDEQIIYDMIAGKMLESLSSVCVKEVTTLTFAHNDLSFIARGTVTKKVGWRGVYNDKEESEETLPEIKANENILITDSQLMEKKTKPKPLYTEGSLLSSMENAGKELEDLGQRKAIKGLGIGTPATRASIIETLLNRNYIQRDKKSLVPTSVGLSVYELVKDKRIANVELTGMWEDALSKIETGEMSQSSLRNSIVIYAEQITNELLTSTVSLSVKKEQMKCPKCGQSSVTNYPKVVKCSEESCGFIIFKQVCEKQLTDIQIQSLLEKKKTGLIKGFKSKAGKEFDAILMLDKDFKIVFSFPQKSKKQKK